MFITNFYKNYKKLNLSLDNSHPLHKKESSKRGLKKNLLLLATSLTLIVMISF